MRVSDRPAHLQANLVTLFLVSYQLCIFYIYPCVHKILTRKNYSQDSSTMEDGIIYTIE